MQIRSTFAAGDRIVRRHPTIRNRQPHISPVPRRSFTTYRINGKDSATSRCNRLLSLQVTYIRGTVSFRISCPAMAFFSATDLTQLAGIVLVSYAIYAYLTYDKRRKHLPPHVKGWPLINQTFVQLEDNPAPRLQQWAKEYGEIFRTTSAATTFIWLNSRKANKELIDRKSAIYSSRHPSPMILDACSGGKRIVFMPYGKDWRALRSIMHRVSHARGCKYT